MLSYKVIFHIDEMTPWKLLLGNVRNLLNGFNEETIDVIVLANSQAVHGYLNQETNDTYIIEMKELSSNGVSFVACNNSLKANQINNEELLEFVKIVPSGVVFLVKKQSEEYAYIKP